MHANHNLLLLENFPHTSSAPKPSTRNGTRGTTDRRKNSSAYGAIQKDSVHCTVDTAGAGRLLSSIWCFHCYVCCYWTKHATFEPGLGCMFLLLNSTLNPFLYCWKIKEVKQAVKDTIGQLSCFCN